ncbi:MAG: dihydrolipoyl dehydrogenase family protein [Leptospirillia bacterium]
MTDAFDLFVIGGGPGGYTCAARAVELGFSVALAEADQLGGVCLNRGCIPTKGLLDAPHPDGIGARVADNARTIERLRRGVGHLLRKVTVFEAAARLAGPGRVAVDGHGEVTAGKVVIATGSTPRGLDLLPFDGTRVLSSDHAVALKQLPGDVVVIGAGAVGCEFADLLSAYGARVTLVEAAGALLPTEDPWLSEHLTRAFGRRGIRMHTNTTVEAAEVAGSGVSLTLSGDGQELQADVVLVAVGRTPLTDGLGLDTVGLSLEAAGHIGVDVHGQSAVDGVYAIGDVVGPPLLAHKAAAQGRIAAEHAAGRAVNPPGPVPTCVYTHPQIASVGKGPGVGLVTGEARFSANGLAVVRSEAEGAVRLVAETASGRLVGAQLAGPEVTEMVGFLGVMVGAGVTVQQLAGAVFPHPTCAETVSEAADRLLARLPSS